MAWRPLLDNRIVIRGLTIKGIQIDIDHSSPTGSPLIGGIQLPVAKSPAATSGTPWGLQLERLTLVESTVRYHRQHLDSELVIDKLWLTNLKSLESKDPADLSFEGRIDNADLAIHGQLSLFAAGPGFSGEIKLNRLALNHYNDLLTPAVTRLNGNLTLNSRLSARQGSDGVIQVTQQGSADIGDLKLTTPQLSLENSKISWKGNLDSRITTNSGSTRLQARGVLESGRLSFKQAKEGAEATKSGAKWEGDLELTLDQNGPNVTTTGNFTIDQLSATLAQTVIGVERLHLSNQAMHLQPQNGGLAITHQGEFTLKSLSLSDPQLALEGEKLSWKGNLQLDNTPAKGLSISAKGALNSGLLNGNLIPSETALGYSDFDWQGEIEAHTTPDSSESGVTEQGDLHLSGITLKSPQLNLSEERLSWSGNLKLGNRNERQHFAAEGALGSEQLSAALVGQALTLEYSALNWDGKLSGESGTALEQLNLSGSLSLDRAQVTRDEDNYRLLFMENLKVERIEGDILERISAAHTAITHIKVGAEPGVDGGEASDLHHSDKIELTGSDYSPTTGIAIEEIRISGSREQLLRQRDKDWNFTRLSNDTSPAEKKPAAEKGESIAIKIGKISLHGDNLIHIEDQSVEPTFKTDITLDQLELKQLDSSQPQQDSPLLLKGRLGKSSKISFDGALHPFSEKLTLDLKGAITGLELPPLSPYAAPALGYTLDSGELSADVQLKADNGALQGENKLTIHQLDVTPLDEKALKAVDGKRVPLETGLGMLRDKNNTIKITLPVSGTIDNLKVDPSDAINQAVTSAVKSGAKTYLTAALFPFGTLLTLAQAVGEEAMKVKLDPLFFEAGGDSFNGKDREYLKKIAHVLSERPEIHIKLCGIAVESDRQALLTEAKMKVAAKQSEKEDEKEERE